jgi:hypothetical protein
MREGVQAANDWLATEHSRKCCQNMIYLHSRGSDMRTLSLARSRTGNWPRRKPSKFLWVLRTTIDAFCEALEMRRVAHQRYPFDDE